MSTRPWKFWIGILFVALVTAPDVTAWFHPASGPDPVHPGETPGTPPDPVAPSVEDLIRATEDPDWTVRWDAVNALGEIKDSRGIPALIDRALYDENPHPQWRSLWALAAVDPKGEQTFPLLRDALKDPDPEVVRKAAIALAFFAQAEARPELLKGLKDPDAARRWEAVFSLKEIGNPEVVKALVPLLDEDVEPVRSVRQEVTLALGRIGGEGVAPALLKALREDESSEVRWRAALALSSLGDPSSVVGLEQALATEENPVVRKTLKEAIVNLQER